MLLEQEAGYGLAALVLYFLPAVIASLRRHHNATAIGVLNLFLGWTVIGWVGALIWALTATRQVY